MKRATDGGLVYHVPNRANARRTIFEKPEDCAALEMVLEEAVKRQQLRLTGIMHTIDCFMPSGKIIRVKPPQ